MLSSRPPIGPYSVRFGGFLRWRRHTLHILADVVRHEQGDSALEFGFSDITQLSVRRGSSRLTIGDGALIARAWWLEVQTRLGDELRVPLHQLHYWDTAIVAVLLAAKAPAGVRTPEFALLAKSSEELLKQPPGAPKGPAQAVPFPSSMRTPPGRRF